jgi:hypothetical protein
MSKKQFSKYLWFNFNWEIKRICKLTITQKWDIFISLPYINYQEDKKITFSKLRFPKRYYENKGIYKADEELSHQKVSITNRDCKISYHPDGFVQFSSVWKDKIISGKDENWNPKWFWIQSFPLLRMCDWPFILMAFFWDLSKFENMWINDSYEIINNIYKRWSIKKKILGFIKWDKYVNEIIAAIWDENNLTIEFFIRYIDNKDLTDEKRNILKTTESEIYYRSSDSEWWDLILKSIFFEVDNKIIILGIRWFNRININDEMTDIEYTISVSQEKVQNTDFNHAIYCFYGDTWNEISKTHINKDIDFNS